MICCFLYFSFKQSKSIEYYIKEKSCTKPYNIRDKKKKKRKKNLLQDAIFDCENIQPKCNITCTNKNTKDKLKNITSKCSCAIEWLLNSMILRSVFTIFIFMLLNTSRSMLINGLCIILWKYLHPPYLTVKANGSANGNIINPDDKDISKYFESFNNSDNTVDVYDDTTTTITSIEDEIDYDDDDDNDDGNALQRHSYYCTQESEKQEEENNNEVVKTIINKKIQNTLHTFKLKGYAMVVFAVSAIILLIVILFRISHSIIPRNWI